MYSNIYPPDWFANKLACNVLYTCQLLNSPDLPEPLRGELQKVLFSSLQALAYATDKMHLFGFDLMIQYATQPDQAEEYLLQFL